MRCKIKWRQPQRGLKMQRGEQVNIEDKIMEKEEAEKKRDKKKSRSMRGKLEN